jgi:rod shape-determining protein MreB and related proteins
LIETEKKNQILNQEIKTLRQENVLLREETGLPFVIPDDPLTAVVLGSGKALDELDLLKNVMLRD